MGFEQFIPKRVSQNDGSLAVELWHGTSLENLKRCSSDDGGRPLLRPRAEHQDRSNWDDAIAPPEFLYLGDFTSAIFYGLVPTAEQGSEVVLCQVLVPEKQLETDPSAKAMFRSALDQLGVPATVEIDAVTAFECTGRIACRGPLVVQKQLTCVDRDRLGSLIAGSGVPELLTKWGDELIAITRAGRDGNTELLVRRATIAVDLASCFNPSG